MTLDNAATPLEPHRRSLTKVDASVAAPEIHPQAFTSDHVAKVNASRDSTSAFGASREQATTHSRDALTNSLDHVRIVADSDKAKLTERIVIASNSSKDHLEVGPNNDAIKEDIIKEIPADDSTEELMKVSEGPANTRKTISILFCIMLGTFLIFALLRRHVPDLATPYCYAVVYIALSSGLINLNKYLMQDSVFPFAMALTTLHMLTTWLGLFALYCIKPEMFPQMQMAQKGAEILGVAYGLPQYFVPIGCFFALGLFGANAAYHYCSVAFLQFCKETNVVWVFCLCVAVGMQELSRARVLTIIWIVIGASLAITGEVHFVLVGFFMQILSQVGEVSKNVLGEWMMTASNFKLDALTYTLSLAPMALVPLALGTAYTFEPELITAFYNHFPILAVDAILAVCLNVAVALVIKHCSAVAFGLIGMIKDIFIVVLSNCLFGDAIARQQVFGFIVCLVGIGAYSSIKQKPEWWQWLSASDGKSRSLSAASDKSRSLSAASDGKSPTPRTKT